MENTGGADSPCLLCAGPGNVMGLWVKGTEWVGFTGTHLA